MKTVNDLIKDVYFPPEQNPSRICKCVEKNLCKGLTNTQVKRMLSAFVNIV